MSNITIQTGRGGQIIFANEKGNTSIRLNQSVATVDDRGFVKVSNRVFYIKGDKESLQALGWTKDTKVPGNLIVQESLEPFNPSNADFDLKVVPGTGVVCSVDGEPIYRRTIWDKSGNMMDTFIQHDNKAEIIAALAERDSNKSLMSATAQEAFDAPVDTIETAVVSEEVTEVAFDNGTHEDYVDDATEDLDIVRIDEEDGVEFNSTFEL